MKREENFNLISKGLNTFQLTRNPVPDKFYGYVHLHEIYEYVSLSVKVKNFNGFIKLYGKYVDLDNNKKEKFYDYPDKYSNDFEEKFNNLNSVRLFD
jgi:hypothetical protein